MIHDPEMSPARKALIAEKRHAYEQRSKKNAEVTPSPVSTGEGWGEGALPDNMEDPAEDIAVTGEGATFPPSASMCHQCSHKAGVIMDGCEIETAAGRERVCKKW